MSSLDDADIFPASVLLAVGRALDQILVVRRHDVVKVFGNLDAFLAHVGLPQILLAWSEQVHEYVLLSFHDRPGRMLCIPRAVLISYTMISGGIVMPPHTCGPAWTRSLIWNRGPDLFRHPAGDVELRHEDVLGVLGRFTNFLFRPGP